jgi:hypothetical protein
MNEKLNWFSFFKKTDDNSLHKHLRQFEVWLLLQTLIYQQFQQFANQVFYGSSDSENEFIDLTFKVSITALNFDAILTQSHLTYKSTLLSPIAKFYLNVQSETWEALIFYLNLLFVCRRLFIAWVHFA